MKFPKPSKIYTRGMYFMVVFIRLKRSFVHFMNVCLFVFFVFQIFSASVGLPFVWLTARNMNVFFLAIESLAKCLFHKCDSQSTVLFCWLPSFDFDSYTICGSNAENGIAFCILQQYIHTNRIQ